MEQYYRNVTTKYETTESIDEYPLFVLAYQILTRYLWMLPASIGVPGNILSILVANRKNNRALSPCIYMMAMAVADTFMLIQHAIFQTVVYFELGQVEESLREALFRLNYCTVYMYAMASGFFLAEMSIDRLIAVRFAMAAPRLCTTSRAIKTVVFTTVLSILFNLQVPFIMVYVKNKVTGTEALITQIPGYPDLEVIACTIHLLMGTVGPFIIIIGCNIVIIVTVKNASSKRAKMSGQGQEGRKEEKQLTRMLIFVSLAYVVTSVPYRLYNLLMDLPALGEIYNMDGKYWNLRYNVQVFAVLNLWFYNYAINFYMYCIGGGAKYRRDAVEVFKQLMSCSVAK